MLVKVKAKHAKCWGNPYGVMDTTNGTSLLTSNLYMLMIQEKQINSAIKRDAYLELRLNVLMTQSLRWLIGGQ